jgi:predicted GIY-YIG superfamily endonuclease
MNSFCYVYILQSTVDAERFYTDLTDDLRDRLKAHNAGRIRGVLKRMLRLAIEYVPPNSNVISNPLQAEHLSRSIFRLWDALAGAKSLASRIWKYFPASKFRWKYLSDKKSANPGRLRQHPRRVRYPEDSAWICVIRGPLIKKEMPDRASLAIRHLVDVQLAAAKTELCVTVVFFELWGAFALQSLYGMSHWMINWFTQRI